MKKLLSLMCSLLMIVTLCGCSSTQDQQEEVTLTFAAAASLENTFEDKLIHKIKKEKHLTSLFFTNYLLLLIKSFNKSVSLTK